MTDFDKTLHAQLRHLIDDLTVAVDDDGHTLYAPKNTLMFSNFIGALIELMPALEARAQPAQVGQVLKRDEIEEAFQQAADADDETHIRFARAIEQTVLAKRVPMTLDQIKPHFQEYMVDDELDFVAGVRFAERHHGITGEKGGA